MTAPEPGIYEDVPDAEYRAWDAVSYSSLDNLISYSPHHYKYFLENPQPPTPEMIFGAAYHDVILLDGSGTATFPGAVRRGKAWDEFRGANVGKTILTADSMAQVEAMRKALEADPDAASLMSRSKRREVSVMGEVGGEPIKCRLDMVADDILWIADLKTCACANPKVWERTHLYQYGYHRQAGLYGILAESVGIFGDGVSTWAWLLQEKTEPYACSVCIAEDYDLQLGYAEIIRAIGTIQECRAKDEWPGYSEGVAKVNLPAWAQKKIMATVEPWLEQIEERDIGNESTD